MDRVPPGRSGVVRGPSRTTPEQAFRPATPQAALAPGAELEKWTVAGT